MEILREPVGKVRIGLSSLVDRCLTAVSLQRLHRRHSHCSCGRRADPMRGVRHAFDARKPRNVFKIACRARALRTSVGGISRDAGTQLDARAGGTPVQPGPRSVRTRARRPRRQWRPGNWWSWLCASWLRSSLCLRAVPETRPFLWHRSRRGVDVRFGFTNRTLCRAGIHQRPIRGADRTRRWSDLCFGAVFFREQGGEGCRWSLFPCSVIIGVVMGFATSIVCLRWFSDQLHRPIQSRTPEARARNVAGRDRIARAV